MTFLLDEIALATARLAEAGVPSPRADAEEIAAFVHGVTRGTLHTVKDSEFDALFWEGVSRRESREPLQHITGRAFFRYLSLEVGPGVFIPRPETEVVVGWAIDRLNEMDVASPIVVDLGTGSGAIALSIAQEVALAQVHAVEIDPAAYRWAKRNILEHGQGRTSLHPEDLADCLPELEGQVDLVISNPPYIPPGAVPRDPEVRDYDPRRALYGSGDDGLGEVRAVEATARRLLRPGGLVAVEHADEQGNAVYWLFPESNGWRDARLRQDLTGRDRFVTAKFGLE
ncbi:peptide chain release factor N(5)-glutamine methyltransferase [Herbidospora sp. NEAU-GS84]|uniref:Release factor glutamine methyltransferase n=1 Tax=Herbidospora solisilvae TaxID=2696284 RepID=A0A7C9JWH2_9ACTN|nr:MULTISPECIES: peptide chain release factor N(5)-glutamine methyltransferase [Herbidospora]NAS24179.1 peptide chain release factor N(5)-glutamine methyltransferase [Herbidospora solisilvae]GLX98223.1 release factor glutamine methyltransferase [Herbidospora sp. NBRC 101105]